jgi:hypothetical protein
VDLFAARDNPDFVDWIYALMDELEFGHFTRINVEIGSDATRDFASFGPIQAKEIEVSTGSMAHPSERRRALPGQVCGDRRNARPMGTNRPRSGPG